MSKQNHPTDEFLLKVIHDDRLETEQVEIETHLSDCHQCQTRLVSLADQAWLNDYRNCLSPDLLSKSTTNSGSGSRAENTQSAIGNSSRPTAAVGSEFESEAIHQMLEKILEPPSHPETLGRLGRYEVESVVGMGGMGLVLRCYDRELQRPVAIKMMLPQLANNGTAKQRFTREARAVAAILHPNVVAIHGVDETKGMPWFAMPFIAGPSLREMVDASGPLPEREIARIGLQIASGLAAAHSQGLVHRDIKPDNILVDNQINRVVITDFGLARRNTEEAITQTGVLAGTLNYMSPEQARGEDLDGRSDLFSLGALLYYLSTGTTPFNADTPVGVVHNVCNKRPVDVRSLNPMVSKTLANTIDTLLAKKPVHRFQSAADAEKFFEEFVSHLNQPTKHRVPFVPRFKRSRAATLAVIAFAFLVTLPVLFYFQFWKSPAPTAESLWLEIQTNYQINSPDEFRDDAAGLGQEVISLENELQQIQDYENASFQRESSRVEGDIRRLDQYLKE